MDSNNSIHSTVQVPVDMGTVGPEAMDGDTTMDTMDAEAAMDGNTTMDTMDGEADTVDTTTYPCHTWVEPSWSSTLRHVFKVFQTQ
jgi:hypothetical protein